MLAVPSLMTEILHFS